MTISSYVVNLLKEYGKLEIDTNHLCDGSDQYGLFKSPSRNIREFNDGSYEITEYYQFLGRQVCVSKEERKEADEWLEDLTYWVDDFSHNYEFPALDHGRRVTALAVTGTPSPMEYQDDDTLFEMAIAITYTRERKTEKWEN